MKQDPSTHSVPIRIPSAVAVAGLLVAVLLAPPAPASAAPAPYVALGDSYSSGTGTRTYLDDGTSCQRSVAAYPSLIAAARGYDLNFRACSGARIPDVSSGQLGALSAATAYVTISVGGNDAGFADVLTTCAMPSWASNCNRAVDRAQAYINNTLPGALGALYASIRSGAPHARVVVAGYPRIFMGKDCNAFTWFSPDEQRRLNETADLLNSRLAAAAGTAGFTFSNPTTAFTGHAVCDNPEWLNGLSYPISESYHPNTRGHRDGYTPLVGPALTGSALTVSASTLAQAERSADELATRQRKYAAFDRTIEPKRFLAPDLTTREVRRAAKAAGVDLDSRASIDRADRVHARKQARQAAGR